jgi:DNA-binding response OmpR family regulator
MRRAREVVTREEILKTLGTETEMYDRTIDSHLSHLRRKLKEADLTDVQITPVYGVGYRLEGR